QRDSCLRLIVKGPVQAAEVQVELHSLALAGWAASPRAERSRSWTRIWAVMSWWRSVRKRDCIAVSVLATMERRRSSSFRMVTISVCSSAVGTRTGNAFNLLVLMHARLVVLCATARKYCLPYGPCVW